MAGRQAFRLIFLFVFAAGCASSSEVRPPDVYESDNVWAGGARYDVTVEIRHERIGEGWRCGERVVEMSASTGLHVEAWHYVRARDYDCDRRFDQIKFRRPSDQERADNPTELIRLREELWFAFGTVVPVENQMR